MKDKRGQALVEFIIIIPVFLTILLSALDLGNIIYKKYHLENDLDYIVDLYNLNKLNEIENYKQKQDIEVYFNKEVETTKITVQKYTNINTPGVNLILKNPYKIEVDRVIYNE